MNSWTVKELHLKLLEKTTSVDSKNTEQLHVVNVHKADICPSFVQNLKPCYLWVLIAVLRETPRN